MAIVDDDVDDDYLVLRAQEGYLDAYNALVDRHSTRIYRLALRLLNNHHDAEDVTQESFVVAWQQLPGYRREASFTTWLYRIAANRALNHARRAQRAEGLALEQLEANAIDPNPGPADQTLTVASTTAVRKAIAELPLEQRVTLVLRQFEQLSYAEIADIRGSSVPAVRSHLLRARRALAQQLKDWR